MDKTKAKGDDNSAKEKISKKKKTSSFVKATKTLAARGALINVKNKEDEECFKWSVLAALHSEKVNKDEKENVESYRKYVHDLNFTNLKCPMETHDIQTFEKQNQSQKIAINIFGYTKSKGGKVFPIFISKENISDPIELLLISNEQKTHYCWIQDFNKLMAGEFQHYCRYCLKGFETKELQQSHQRLCEMFEPQILKLPPDSKLKDNLPDKTLQAPFIIYAKFVCIQKPSQGSSQCLTERNMETLTDHQPSGYAYKVVGLTENDSKPVVVYRGENVVEKFMKDMHKEKDWIKNKLRERNKQKQFWSYECYTCKDTLNTSPHQYFDAISGKSFGKICWKCNSQYNEQVPVIVHDLTNYDGHFIINHRESAEMFKFGNPLSIDKYSFFALKKKKKRQNKKQAAKTDIEEPEINYLSLKFIDSKEFFDESFGNLVSSLEANKNKSMKHCEPDLDVNRHQLILRKLVYPHDYIDSSEKFLETLLPDKTNFKTKLTNEDISEEDYTHAQTVWRVFNIQNLGEYHDLYVKSEVLLLVNAFENFRELCKEKYSLDPAYSVSLAGLSWTAALKQTKPELDLLTDREMYLMIESGIRGGVAMVSHRFAKANNPLLPGYESTKPDTYIIYLDANNLYGWAMSQYLPTGEFKWLTPEEVQTFNLEEKQINSETGYILEVDLEYPDDLHDEHNDYPLAPEKIVITNDMLSPFNNELFIKLEKKDSHTPKYVPNLRNKEKYVIHYRALKLYVQLGLRLTKIHRIVSFNQSPWLKPYIDYNTERRKEATNKSDRDMFKLMNNSIYGKTFLNRSYKNLKLCTTETEVKKQELKLDCLEKKAFSNGITAVLKKKIDVVLDKPIYIGFSVLDLSKSLIYDFHYNFIRQKYKDKAKLLFTDTDSLCYEIQTENIYDDILQEADRFDTSDYPQGHKLQSDENKKVVGKMKDETNGVPISEFVGLRPKMYSLKYGDSGKKCAVGVDKNYREQKLSHDDYKKCLENLEQTEIEPVKITSIGHRVHTVREISKGLSPYDDKRYVLDDKITTLAYGHKNIPVVDEMSAATSM